jgi:hypothetical protein
MQFFTIGLILVSLTSYGSALVINSADLLPKKHPKGATIKSFTSNQKHFAGLLTLPANGKVPVHRDPTVEMLYFIKGSGTIWIDGKAYHSKTWKHLSICLLKQRSNLKEKKLLRSFKFLPLLDQRQNIKVGNN